jgi:hypothetical protein
MRAAELAECERRPTGAADDWGSAGWSTSGVGGAIDRSIDRIARRRMRALASRSSTFSSTPRLSSCWPHVATWRTRHRCQWRNRIYLIRLDTNNRMKNGAALGAWPSERSASPLQRGLVRRCRGPCRGGAAPSCRSAARPLAPEHSKASQMWRRAETLAPITRDENLETQHAAQGVCLPACQRTSFKIVSVCPSCPLAVGCSRDCPPPHPWSAGFHPSERSPPA